MTAIAIAILLIIPTHGLVATTQVGGDELRGVTHGGSRHVKGSHSGRGGNGTGVAGQIGGKDGGGSSSSGSSTRGASDRHGQGGGSRARPALRHFGLPLALRSGGTRRGRGASVLLIRARTVRDEKLADRVDELGVEHSREAGVDGMPPEVQGSPESVSQPRIDNVHESALGVVGSEKTQLVRGQLAQVGEETSVTSGNVDGQGPRGSNATGRGSSSGTGWRSGSSSSPETSHRPSRGPRPTRTGGGRRERTASGRRRLEQPPEHDVEERLVTRALVSVANQHVTGRNEPEHLHQVVVDEGEDRVEAAAEGSTRQTIRGRDQTQEDLELAVALREAVQRGTDGAHPLHDVGGNSRIRGRDSNSRHSRDGRGARRSGSSTNTTAASVGLQQSDETGRQDGVSQPLRGGTDELTVGGLRVGVGRRWTSTGSRTPSSSNG